MKIIHRHNADAKCFLIVDEDSSDVVTSPENKQWLRVIPAPFPMLQFAAELVDAINESCD